MRIILKINDKDNLQKRVEELKDRYNILEIVEKEDGVEIIAELRRKDD